MSLALPLFQDLTKAASDVLHGTLQGEGAFTTAAQVKAQSVTAGGVILNASTRLSPAQGLAAPSLTLMSSPTKSLLLMGIFDATGSATGSVTASSLFGQPGLQATLTAAPPAALNKALAGSATSASLTLDYTNPHARLRAVLSPSDPSRLVQSVAAPTAQLSGTTAVGPCVLGARLGLDGSAAAAGGRLTSWAVGANFTRMAAAEEPGGVERLSGQQWGVLVTDTPASGGSRSATCSFHQLLSGGRVDLAAEYTLPLHAPARAPTSITSMHLLSHGSSSSADAYDLTLGVSRRLESGGLVKARVKHMGQVGLLYQQAVPGVGQVGWSVTLDPTQLHKVAPAMGVTVTL